MTDEEDGRPGSVALQFGHLDALTDVPTAFLRPAHPLKNSFCVREFPRNSFVHSHPGRKMPPRGRRPVPRGPAAAARAGRPRAFAVSEAGKQEATFIGRLAPPQAAARFAGRGEQICNAKEKHHENVPGK